jgi:hypothetical protein
MTPSPWVVYEFPENIWFTDPALSLEQIFHALRIEQAQTSPPELGGLQRSNSLADSGRDSAEPLLDLTEQHLHLTFDTAFNTSFRKTLRQALADRRANDPQARYRRC